MNKYKYLILLFIGMVCNTYGQQKQEWEHRIPKEVFPPTALALLKPYLKNAKRIRFYQEKDGQKVSFESKFKLKRIFYSVEFSKNGSLEDVEFIIAPYDMPNETWETISNFLDTNYDRYRIKKIQQQYILNGNAKNTLKQAFQNLILDTNNFEIIIAYRTPKGFKEMELLFNATGKLLSKRESEPQKYDHVRY